MPLGNLSAGTVENFSPVVTRSRGVCSIAQFQSADNLHEKKKHNHQDKSTVTLFIFLFLNKRKKCLQYVPIPYFLLKFLYVHTTIKIQSWRWHRVVHVQLNLMSHCVIFFFERRTISILFVHSSLLRNFFITSGIFQWTHKKIKKKGKEKKGAENETIFLRWKQRDQPLVKMMGSLEKKTSTSLHVSPHVTEKHVHPQKKP